mgnify:FL=1
MNVRNNISFRCYFTDSCVFPAVFQSFRFASALPMGENKPMSIFDISRENREKLCNVDSYLFPAVTILTALCLTISIIGIYRGTQTNLLPLFSIPAILLVFSRPKGSVIFSTSVCIMYTVVHFIHGKYYTQPPELFVRTILAPAGLFELLSILTALAAWPRVYMAKSLTKEIERLNREFAEKDKTLAELKNHHKRTEEALDESGKRLQALIEQIGFPVVKINSDLYITAVNSHFLRFTGKMESELIGRNIAALPEFHSRLTGGSSDTFILPSNPNSSAGKHVWRISKITPDTKRDMYYILITGVDVPSE